MPQNKIGNVVSCSPSSIVVNVVGLDVIEQNKAELQVGRYLSINQGNRDKTIAVIRNIHGTQTFDEAGAAEWNLQIDCQAVGTLVDGQEFERSSVLLPVPTEEAFTTDADLLSKMYRSSEHFNHVLGHLSLNPEVPIPIHGDRFFSKHIAVVGSTGSGKSCTVARILQDVVGIDKKTHAINARNNSHIVIFDIHDEYDAAFRLQGDVDYNLNRLDINSLILPYWLMNADELESMFIESNEANSHNQVSIFKQAVIANKEKHNPHIDEVTYGMPVYFSIIEVYNYISNMNREVIGRLKDEDCPKLADDTLVKDRKEKYFESVHNFAPTSTAAAKKATQGPFYGEFNRFVSRLETRLQDKRLQFLLDRKKADNSDYLSSDFEMIVKQFIGYIDRSNVSIVDLSGVPFEVLSITVSLVSRIIFDFCFHYSKLQHSKGLQNDVPVLLVCEEAHNYIPRNDSAAYRASRFSIERIAKEGRKYGLSLMVVSQRPSEVSETVFAQCNNFLALRLTNRADQDYVRRLFPDHSAGIADTLPNLAPGECIAVGDAMLLPAIVQIRIPDPEPHSQSVAVKTQWIEPWKDVEFTEVVSRWTS